MEKALVLLLSLSSVCWCKPTTVVNFSPVGNSPGIAPGFAYAFRAPAPLFSPTSVYTGANPIVQEPVNNGISAPPAKPTVLKTQYHSQDLLGQYAFGYVGDASTAHEVRTHDGAVRGSYTYLDSNGELQTANYIADGNGFRVEATNLPLAPTAPAMPKMLLPEPVKPTPEVEAATAAHLKAVAEIKAARKTRSVPSKGYLPPSATPVKKEYAYSPISTKVKPVPIKITPIPVKEEPVPVKEILTIPTFRKVSRIPAAAPVPVFIEHHPTPLQVLPGPFPFHTAAASQAVFVKTVPTESKVQVSAPITVAHPAPIAVSHPAPLSVIAPAAPVPAAPSQVLSQFHSQNELGGFEYGYEGGPSSKHEIHTPDGITRGSYSYVDANGELQTISYIADDVLGFRVQATNLPVAPADPWASKKEAV